MRGTELSCAKLRGRDLFGRDFTEAYLDGVEPRGANLRFAHLVDAYLAGRKLDGAGLTNADLTGSDIEDDESMSGTVLVGTVGLTEEQHAACRAKGADLGQRAAAFAELVRRVVPSASSLERGREKKRWEQGRAATRNG